MPITLADVDDRIRRALAAERNHQQRLLNDFADQLRDDLEKIVLSLTAEIAELSRLLAELPAVQGKPLTTPLPADGRRTN